MRGRGGKGEEENDPKKEEVWDGDGNGVSYIMHSGRRVDFPDN